MALNITEDDPMSVKYQTAALTDGKLQFRSKGFLAPRRGAFTDRAGKK